MKVSVLMPAFNAAATVPAAVRSILSQSHEDWELIVIDDCSTDSTIDELRRFSDQRIQVFLNDTNIGSLLTRNRLLELASGEFVAWQDADDLSHPRRLECQLEAFRRHPEAVVCGTNFRRDLAGGRRVLVSRYPESDGAIRAWIAGNREVPFCAPSTMMRRAAVNSVGGFREFFKDMGWYDYDLILRLGEHGGLINLCEVLYDYRYTPTSQSRSLIGQGIKKLFANDVGLALALQRGNHGRDAVGDAALMKEIDDLLAGFADQLALDPSYTYWRRSRSCRRNMDFGPAYSFAWQAISTGPNRTRNWVEVVGIFLSQAKSLVFDQRSSSRSHRWGV